MEKSMASNEKYENETTSTWYDHPKLHVVLHLVENFICKNTSLTMKQPEVKVKVRLGVAEFDAGLKWR